jgi:hypothetical protein
MKLAGTGRQIGGMFGESTDPVDNNVPRYAPLSGNRKRTEQGVLAQPTGCYSAVRLTVLSEGNVTGSLAYLCFVL